MVEFLVVLSAENPSGVHAARQKVEEAGGRILQRYGNHVLIVEGPSEIVPSLGGREGIAGVFQGAAPKDVTENLDDTGQLGIAAWNTRHTAAYTASKRERKGEGLAWDHPGFEPEGREEP